MDGRTKHSFRSQYTREEALALIERLRAATELEGARFDPCLPGEGGLILRTPSHQVDVRLAVAAMDWFTGRIPEDERLEIGQGLVVAIGLNLGMSTQAMMLSWSDSDASATIDSFWELLDRILGWLRNVADVAEFPYVLGPGLVTAAAICIYYQWIAPPVPPCPVTVPDKWKHCYVGCKLSFWAPGGFVWATLAAFMKEVLDAMGFGTADVEDFVESIRGAGACGYFQSCADCCCEKGY